MSFIVFVILICSLGAPFGPLGLVGAGVGAIIFYLIAGF